MNTLPLSGLALLAMASVVLGFACRPETCNTVRCVPLTPENCNYTIVEKGGSCGCCDACVHILNEGEECPVSVFKGGAPPTTRCADGLSCSNETGKCLSNTSK